MEVLSKVTLPRNPDSVEFCRHDGFSGIAAVGTYSLRGCSAVGTEESSHGLDWSTAGLLGADCGGGLQRHGSIELFELDSASSSLHLRLSCDSAAVLDLKWGPPSVAMQSVGATADGGACLAAAGADGCVDLHILRVEESGPPGGSELPSRSRNFSLDRLSHSPANLNSGAPDSDATPPGMCLSLDWSAKDPMQQIVVSRSDGHLAAMGFREGTQLTCLQDWEAHGYEAWTCAFDIWRPAVVYSGGDDCSFAIWDMRARPCSPMFRTKKAHNAGVTSIQCSPLSEHCVATGSYDEHMRFWDARSMSRPVEACKLPVGGGVWRIKWHPWDPRALLAACMQGGLAAVQAPKFLSSSSGSPGHAGASGEPDVVGKGMQTERALVYGADWPFDASNTGKSTSDVKNSSNNSCLAVGCSFYEKTLQVIDCSALC